MSIIERAEKNNIKQGLLRTAGSLTQNLFEENAEKVRWNHFSPHWVIQFAFSQAHYFMYSPFPAFL